MLVIIVGVIFCGFVACVGLSNAEVGLDAMEVDQAGHSQAAMIIKGEVLRVEGDQLFVKGENGKEVRLHIDQTTRKGKKILLQGELIEATVNEEYHALSINSPEGSGEEIIDPGHIMEPPRK